MRFLEHIAVILLTSMVVIGAMNAYTIYIDLTQDLASTKAQLDTLINACGVQLFPAPRLQ